MWQGGQATLKASEKLHLQQPRSDVDPQAKTRRPAAVSDAVQLPGCSDETLQIPRCRSHVVANLETWDWRPCIEGESKLLYACFVFVA